MKDKVGGKFYLWKSELRNKVHLVQVWNFNCFISCLMASNSNARMLLTWLGKSLTLRSAMVECGVLSWSTRWCSILEDKKMQEFLRKNMRTSCAEWMLIAKKEIGDGCGGGARLIICQRIAIRTRESIGPPIERKWQHALEKLILEHQPSG
jgi:hypothetical protein